MGSPTLLRSKLSCFCFQFISASFLVATGPFYKKVGPVETRNTHRISSKKNFMVGTLPSLEVHRISKRHFNFPWWENFHISRFLQFASTLWKLFLRNTTFHFLLWCLWHKFLQLQNIFNTMPPDELHLLIHICYTSLRCSNKFQQQQLVTYLFDLMLGCPSGWQKQRTVYEKPSISPHWCLCQLAVDRTELFPHHIPHIYAIRSIFGVNISTKTDYTTVIQPR